MGERVRTGPGHSKEETMKYMLIMRATDEAYAAYKDVDFSEIIESMGRFNDEMISAGVLVAAEGLDDASQGVVVDYSSEPASCERSGTAAVRPWPRCGGSSHRASSARSPGSPAISHSPRTWPKSRWPRRLSPGPEMACRAIPRGGC